ncbi:hypothetical protein B296_00015361 [Ensete ventricosum]|uniref:Cell wall hydroxyproline-rich glycoprotein n=1 Tax=Ensete ventricosum TaxID=4639 RepID=A0A427ACA6_ENSVE|nr:hypothetical protein B296_00015361 [Ensete ventricosum]
MATITSLRKALVCILLLLLLFCLPFLSLSEYYLPINPRLEKAYVALQAWKHAITADPKNLTLDWCGPHVCNYTGVFCAPAPDDRHELTVAAVDLNHGRIAGTLPEDLGLLSDLALLHLNSNRFHGGLPEAFERLQLLYELDVSNNRLQGPFPAVVLHLPLLKYLDIRFNRFRGEVPRRVFDLRLDALFLNDNQFAFSLPDSIGNSSLSVLVVANNRISGCFPRSITDTADTLNELILLNASITSCIPEDIGKLKNLTVFDVSFNNIVGPLPNSIGEMRKLEQLNVAHNNLSGDIPESICELPRLKNFTYAYNYFCGEPERCLKIRRSDDRENCIPERPHQRSEEECIAFSSKPVHCDSNGCTAPPPPPVHH